MENCIIIGIVLCIVGGAALYLYRAKKKGAACIGCPYAKQCSSKCCCGGEDKAHK